MDFACKNCLAHRFWADEAGAVTVDWVVLSAAVIGFGMIVLIPVAFSTHSASQGVSDYIAETPIGIHAR